MLKVLLFGILAGLDNFQVSTAVGLMGVPLKRQLSITAVFAFFEMTMPFVGVLIGSQMQNALKGVVPWLGPAFMAVIGAVMIIRALMEKDQTEMLQKDAVVVPMAFFMSLDNLVAGVGFGVMGYSFFSTAFIMGLCSAAMCFLGLFVGDKVRRFVPGKIEVVTGLYLIALAIFKLKPD